MVYQHEQEMLLEKLREQVCLACADASVDCGLLNCQERIKNQLVDILTGNSK